MHAVEWESESLDLKAKVSTAEQFINFDERSSGFSILILIKGIVVCRGINASTGAAGAKQIKQGNWSYWLIPFIIIDTLTVDFVRIIFINWKSYLTCTIYFTFSIFNSRCSTVYRNSWFRYDHIHKLKIIFDMFDTYLPTFLVEELAYINQSSQKKGFHWILVIAYEHFGIGFSVTFKY